MKSVITEYTTISAFSKCELAECRHHLIYGTGLRKLAEEDGLWIPLTNYQHNMGPIIERIHGNIAAEKMSKIGGQLGWEKNYYLKALVSLQEIDEGADPARELFLERYGISYL